MKTEVATFGGSSCAASKEVRAEELPHVLVADPPWLFRDGLPGTKRGAVKHYPCMSLSALLAFPIPRMAPDSVLFMWRVAALQQEALELVHAWGFSPKTELVWQKTTRTGKKHFGMGRILRASHESCIVATRGRALPKVRNVRSTFEAAVGRHSEKPDAFFRIVEALYDGPYVELFARRQREGWVCIGDGLSGAE